MHVGFSLLLRFPLVTMLTFCTIIRKRDHQKFLNFLLSVVIISMLVEFSQNHVFPTLLKCLNVPHPSMFTSFCINYYAHATCGEKKILPPIEIIKKSTVTLPTCSTSKLPMCLLKCSYGRRYDFFLLCISKITVPHIRVTHQEV